MHGQSYADAAPKTSRAAFAAFLFPLYLLLHNPQAFGQPATSDYLVIAFFAFASFACEQNLVAHLDPVLARNLVNVALQREEALRQAIATESSGRGQIGVDHVCLEPQIRTGIDW